MMVAYNFQARFAADVELGKKRQTIRAPRKSRHAAVREPVQLYTGMRSSSCRKLVDPDPVCTYSGRLILQENGIDMEESGGCFATNSELMAKRDGFENFEAMKAWFREAHGLPFTGQLIMWEPR